MPVALLLAMQAAGMIVDYMGTKNQQQLADMGAKIQQAGIEANIEQARLSAEDDSLQSLKKLRQTMGSTLALFAARGTSSSAGSASSILNSSVGNFNSDERMRRLNLRGKENELKASGVISKLNQSANNSQMWQGFAQRSIQNFPTSLGGTSGSSGKTAFAGSKGSVKSSYGLTGNV